MNYNPCIIDGRATCCTCCGSELEDTDCPACLEVTQDEAREATKDALACPQCGADSDGGTCQGCDDINAEHKKENDEEFGPGDEEARSITKQIDDEEFGPGAEKKDTAQSAKTLINLRSHAPNGRAF